MERQSMSNAKKNRFTFAFDITIHHTYTSCSMNRNKWQLFCYVCVCACIYMYVCMYVHYTINSIHNIQMQNMGTYHCPSLCCEWTGLVWGRAMKGTTFKAKGAGLQYGIYMMQNILFPRKWRAKFHAQCVIKNVRV